jgi:hypothetical protein
VHYYGGRVNPPRIARLRFPWLTSFRFVWSGTAAGYAPFDKATCYAEVGEQPNPTHRIDSTVPDLLSLATVAELRMGGASLDRFRAPGAVEAADGHPKRTGVEAAT